MGIYTIKQKIVSILKANGVTKAAFFGSLARGDVDVRSDVDLLVEFLPDAPVLSFMVCMQN